MNYQVFYIYQKGVPVLKRDVIVVVPILCPYFFRNYQMNYHKIYDSIINNSKNRVIPKDVYTERHHVIPKCMGGDKGRANIVIITAREHYICHHLLWKMYPNNSSLLYAYSCMVFIKKPRCAPHKISSKEYAILRKKISEDRILWHKNNDTWNKGKKLSLEDRKNKSISGKKRFSEHPEDRIRQSNKLKGYYDSNPNFNKGGNNGRSCPITIDGIYYSCMVEAGKKLGKTISQIITIRDNCRKKGIPCTLSPEHHRIFKANPIKCIIFGVIYNSIAEASRYFNIGQSVVSRRIKSGSFPDWCVHVSNEGN